MADVELNVKGLEQLIKSLKNMPIARVGILGDKSTRGSGRSQKSPTNAQIGAWHEFGTTRLPVRSFLRLPITTLLDKRLQQSGAFNKDVMRRVIQGGSIVPWLKLVAIEAEGIVAGAFDSGGYGTWPPSDMRYKKNFQTLIETQQLRNSISSEVKEAS